MFKLSPKRIRALEASAKSNSSDHCVAFMHSCRSKRKQSENRPEDVVCPKVTDRQCPKDGVGAVWLSFELTIQCARIKASPLPSSAFSGPRTLCDSFSGLPGGGQDDVLGFVGEAPASLNCVLLRVLEAQKAFPPTQNRRALSQSTEMAIGHRPQVLKGRFLSESGASRPNS